MSVRLTARTDSEGEGGESQGYPTGEGEARRMPSFLGGKSREAALFVESYSLCKSTLQWFTCLQVFTSGTEHQ